MPQVKMLKSVTDRMKNLSNYVTLMTNIEGEMRLCIETDLARVTTRFELLEKPIIRKFTQLQCSIAFSFQVLLL